MNCMNFHLCTLIDDFLSIRNHVCNIFKCNLFLTNLAFQVISKGKRITWHHLTSTSMKIKFFISSNIIWIYKLWVITDVTAVRWSTFMRIWTSVTGAVKIPRLSQQTLTDRCRSITWHVAGVNFFTWHDFCQGYQIELLILTNYCFYIWPGKSTVWIL